MCVDGQKIAKRLSVSITKETKTAKKLLQEYNAAASAINDAHVPICVEEALLPDSDFWQTVAMPSSSPLSWSTKKDITSAYLLKKRSEEELRLLKGEMQNVLVYCRQFEELLNNLIDNTRSSVDQYSKGLASLLLKKLEDVRLYHSTAEATFTKVEGLLPSTESSDNESESSDEDTDSDSSDEDLYDNIMNAVC